MAGRGAMLCASAVLVLCLWVGAGEAAVDCTSAVAGLAGCLTFLTNSSSTPDQKSCCTPLNTVLSTPSSFQCLCDQASSTDSQESKNALLLPKACKLAINVSQANCTATSSATNTTTPGASNSSSSAKGSAGVIPASTLSSLLALALVWSVVSSFV